MINTLDKASGLINVSYNGDPESFVSCGVINSYVKNARGERTYNFPAAASQQNYEVMDGGKLSFVEGRMNLEGRMNIIFESLSPTQTKVTAITRYIVTRRISVRPVTAPPWSATDTIHFDSGRGGTFPGRGSPQVTCYPTGQMESEILQLIK